MQIQSAVFSQSTGQTTVVQYKLYELYDWGKVPELYGTLQWTWNFMELLRILSFALLVNLS